MSPGVLNAMKSLQINYHRIPKTHRIDSAFVFGLDGVSFEADLEENGTKLLHGLTIKRLDLDNLLISSAKERGLSFFPEVRFLDYQNMQGKVIVNLLDKNTKTKFSRTCRLLVGADGANSRVRKCAGISPVSAKNTAIAIRAYCSVVSKKENSIILSYGEYFRPGYGWCFQLTDGEANVGYGLTVHDHRKSGKKLEFLLDSYIASLRKEGIICSDINSHSTYILPTGGSKRFISDGVALVGDAASMINPLSGEGIVYGMEAGRILAEELVPTLNSGAEIYNSLIQYQKKYKSMFGHHFLSCKIANRLLRSKVWTRMILGAASVDKKTQKAGIDLMFGKGSLTIPMIYRAINHGWRFSYAS